MLIRSHAFARLWSLYSLVDTPRKFWWGCEVCFLKPRPFVRPKYVVFVSPFHISNIFFKKKVIVKAYISQWCQIQDKILPFFSSKQLKSGPNFKPRRVIHHTLWYLPLLRLWSITVLRELMVMLHNSCKNEEIFLKKAQIRVTLKKAIAAAEIARFCLKKYRKRTKTTQNIVGAI